ncbi:MAG: hypothetical protein ACRENP_06705 [Longimicrobiales bacterium]
MWPARVLDSLSDRDRRAIRIGLLILLPAMGYVAAFKPYRAALLDTRDRVAAERKLLERELALLADKDSLPISLATAHSSVKRAESRLVKAANLTSAENRVTELLEQIAELSRVLLQEVRSVAPDRDEKSPAGMQLLRLAVRGESDLEGVVTYLQRIEQSPLLLRVRELTIENAPPPRLEPRGRAGSRPTRRPQLGVMRFTVLVEAFAPVTTSAQELP